VSFNAGFGAHYYNNRFWLGFSVPELLYNRFVGAGDATAITINPKDFTYQVVGGWKKDIGRYITAKPSMMVRYSPNAPLQFDINGLFEYKEQIGVGVSYRTMNSLNLLANYRLSRDFKLGYAFNTQLGTEISNYNAGTHEIALIYGVGNNRKANVNLHKQVSKYRKQKLKEIKKAVKETEKQKKAAEKAAQEEQSNAQNESEEPTEKNEDDSSDKVKSKEKTKSKKSKKKKNKKGTQLDDDQPYS
jgi:hypothetical protein